MASVQQAMLVRPWVTGGTNLGTESYSRGDSPDNPAVAIARFNFNTAGTVTVSGNGNTTPTNTTPFTNWNTNGGTYLSYEVIGRAVAPIGGGQGSYSVTGSLAPSSPYGENRHQVSATQFQIICNASFDSTNGDTSAGSASQVLKISIWSAATGGTRQAFGIYTVSASSS